MSYLRASNAMPIKYKHFCLSRLSRLNSSTPQLHNSITLQHRFQFWIWSWYTQMPIACNALTDSKLSWKRNGSAQSSPDTSRHAYINLCKWVCVCVHIGFYCYYYRFVHRLSFASQPSCKAATFDLLRCVARWILYWSSHSVLCTVATATSC